MSPVLNVREMTPSQEAFAYWLSGFVDGEGCFAIYRNRERRKGGDVFHVRVLFTIVVRLDDKEILDQIQQFLGIGKVKRRNCRKRGLEKDGCAYLCENAHNLFSVIIPLFERFPLRAKKKRDFKVWKKAVKIRNKYSQQNKIRMGSEDWNELKRLWKKIKIVRQFRCLEAELEKENKNGSGNIRQVNTAV